VIVVVPGATPVTVAVVNGEVELTVATLVFDEVHGVVASGVPEPVKVDGEPRQTVVEPVIDIEITFTVTCWHVVLVVQASSYLTK
jgi:hypothetical protein